MTTKGTEPGRYGPDSELVDFILGITFEIWEGRGVDLIRQYYAPDCVVYGLSTPDWCCKSTLRTWAWVAT